MNAIEKINKAFKGKLKVFGKMSIFPTLKDLGDMDVHPDIQKEADEFAKKLSFDEKQAVLELPLAFSSEHAEWGFKKAKYSYINARRNRGDNIEAVTVNIMPTIKKDNESYFLMQQRSLNSILNPGHYSIFGGAVSPDETLFDIKNTAIKELKEEIEGVTSSNSELMLELDKAPAILTQEMSNGNVQINFMSLPVEIDKNMQGNIEEGGVVLVKASEINTFLDENQNKMTELALATYKMFGDYIKETNGIKRETNSGEIDWSKTFPENFSGARIISDLDKQVEIKNDNFLTSAHL